MKAVTANDATHSPNGQAKLKIAMFGHCYLVHIGPLVAALKRTRPGTFVAVEETVCQPSPGQIAEWNALSQRYGLDAFVTPSGAPGSAASFSERVSRRFQHLRRAALRSAHLQSPRTGGDLYHLHWPSPHSRGALRSLPADKPLVVSFWGHDVLDGSCLQTHMFQRAAIERADIVTVRSIDLREHLYSKFGRQFAPKVRLAKFANDMFRERADLCLPRLRSAFRERHQIGATSIVIAIGHSGYEKERHLAVLETLRNLPVQNRDVVLMLPVTYGGEPGYLHQVRIAAEQTGLRYVMLDTFTDRHGVWESRAAADIFVSVPDEDSFSGAMCEFILAGAVAIVGDWLPYGALRRLQVYHRSVETAAGARPQILAAIADLPAERRRVEQTADALRVEVDIDTTVAGWWVAYDDALAAAATGCTSITSTSSARTSP